MCALHTRESTLCETPYSCTKPEGVVLVKGHLIAFVMLHLAAKYILGLLQYIG